MNEGEDAGRDVTLVHAAVAGLARVARAARIYLPNNEVLLTFKAELYEQMRAVLESRGELELVLKPGEILCDGTVAYHDIGSGEGLVAKLHRDGMRKLVLREGVTQEELDDLLDVVVTNYEDETNLEDDLVTKVWEKDFDNIEVTISEEILRSADVWDPNAVDPEKVASYLEYDGAEEEATEPDEGSQAAFAGALGPATYRHTVTVEELRELEREVQRSRRGDPLIEFNELVFEILDGQRTADQVRILLDAAARDLDALAEQGSYEVAAETVERLRSVGLLLDIADMDVAQKVEEILSNASKESVKQALSNAEQAQDVRTEELALYLKALDGDVVPYLLDRLAETRKPHIRAALVDAITEHCRQQVDRLGSRLVADPSSPAVRDLLAIMAAIGDPRGLRYFQRFVGHPDAGVRAEVIRALAKFESQEVLPMLIGLLRDPEERLRLTAIRQMAHRKDVRALEKIQERIEDSKFNRLSLTEQRFLFTATAVLGGESVVPYLAAFLKETGGFRGHGSPRGLNAVHALVTINGSLARAALERGAGAAPKRIREACVKSLSRLGGQKEKT